MLYSVDEVTGILSFLTLPSLAGCSDTASSPSPDSGTADSGLRSVSAGFSAGNSGSWNCGTILRSNPHISSKCPYLQHHHITAGKHVYNTFVFQYQHFIASLVQHVYNIPYAFVLCIMFMTNTLYKHFSLCHTNLF